MDTNGNKTKHEQSDVIVNKCSCDRTSYNLNYVNYPIISIMGLLLYSCIVHFGVSKGEKSNKTFTPCSQNAPIANLSTHTLKNYRKENP